MRQLHVWSQSGLLSQFQASHKARPHLNFLPPLRGKNHHHLWKYQAALILFHSLMLLSFCVIQQGTTILTTCLFYEFCWCSKMPMAYKLVGEWIYCIYCVYCICRVYCICCVYCVCCVYCIYCVYCEDFTWQPFTLTASKTSHLESTEEERLWLHLRVQHLEQHRIHCEEREPLRGSWQAGTTAGAKVPSHRKPAVDHMNHSHCQEAVLSQVYANMLWKGAREKQTRQLLLFVWLILIFESQPVESENG